MRKELDLDASALGITARLIDKQAGFWHFPNMARNGAFALIAAAWLLVVCNADADGCFVFHWAKQKDINEPTQKAIILHNNGWEDMILQVKYEGPAEDFGWLIPVPGLPEVRKGSMDCFYEVSRLTQKRFPSMENFRSMSASLSAVHGEDENVKVIEVKTVGAYEVTVLSATNAASLADWLDAHNFAFPKDKQNVLDDYVKKHWYFVAAKIDPNEDGFAVLPGSSKKGHDRSAISPSTRKELANGELHPLIMSFPSEKCVYPLAISSINGKPSEISLYLLSSEPLASRVIFDKKFTAYSRKRADQIQQSAERRKKFESGMTNFYEKQDQRLEEVRRKRAGETPGHGLSPGGGLRANWLWEDDPADPRPGQLAMRQLLGPGPPVGIRPDFEDEVDGGEDLVQSLEVAPKDIPACSEALPRLGGKSWWLTKQVEVFAPEEMRDLEFEPAVPILAAKLGTPEGRGAASSLASLGGYAVPVMLAGLKSPNPIERRWSASAIENMKDSRLAAVVPGLLGDADARIRLSGCYAAGNNWEAAFAPRLAKLLGDTNEAVRSAARFCLMPHRDEDASQIPVYRKMLDEDGAAASQAIVLLSVEDFPRKQLVHYFSSTNLSVVSTVFSRLRYKDLQLDEIEPLLANSLVMARMMGLGALTQMGDKKAVDRIVAMLRDPNEAVRWNVRAKLRSLIQQKLGSDPAAYEKWWAENKNTCTLHPPPRRDAGGSRALLQ
jgi:HEAT repeat protein